ncbi:hypothetical protein SCACP_21240 [Sporomusa carbonis]|uniref:hypothetical protein n=1 Tax=Sporomusa carbonis TaxID=3076075 RepID=UPI003A614CE6
MAEKIVKYQGDTTLRELWANGPQVSSGVSRLLDPTGRNFSAVMWQQGKPPLDSELNLLQQIQNHLRAEMVRAILPSGILQMDVQTDITSPLNSIRISNTIACVNGWLARINGANRTDDASDIIFPEAPYSGVRYDLAFIEFWFEEVAPSGSPETDSEAVYRYGGVQSGTLANDLQDPTAGDETTRRLQFRWRLRTVSDIDFTTYPKGVNHTARVKAWGGNAGDTNYVFSSSVADTALFVAGDGSAAACDALKCATGYVYALAFFKVMRRNQAAYDAITNPDGAPGYGATNTTPSQLYHNVIVAQDIKPIFYQTGIRDRLHPEMDSMAAVLLEAMSGLRGINLELEKWKKQRLQQGSVVIYNKFVIDGGVISAVPGTRNLQISRTGTFNAAAASKMYIDGKIVVIPDEQTSVAAVPPNAGATSQTYYAYVDYDNTQQRYRVFVDQTVPEGKLKLYRIVVPAGDQTASLDACTFYNERRIEAAYTCFYTTQPFALVNIPGFWMPDANYDVQLTVEDASDMGRVGELIVYDKAYNGFKVRSTGAADAIRVRWTLINPNA